MSEIRFVDTTLRDGHQSLWALGMRTGMMLSVANDMDRAGFESVEFFVKVMFRKFVREHREDPWDWLRLGTRCFRHTRLRNHGGMHSAFEKVPACVLQLLTERLVFYGITLTRTSNPWNDYEPLRDEVQEMRALGMDTVVNLIFSVSPRHTDEYYARKTREAAAIRPWRICFKDVGGLLTPERTRRLVPLILENAGSIPVEFHTHCNNGLAPLNCLEAARLGLHVLHTAIPPLANGSSQPSIFNVAQNLRALGYQAAVDEKALEPVRAHLTSVARREGLPIGVPSEYDQSQYLHQIPGGMISNLRHQLRIVGMEHRIEQTLEEAARVRSEFGYPIMVTPLSQFVGSQAGINVIVGERYREVTDQTIQYALGLWGKEGAELMDPNVKDKILSRPRANEWKNWAPEQPSLSEVRERYGGSSARDEELILRVFAGTDHVENMQRAGRPKGYLNSHQPLVRLVAELAQKRESTHISVQRSGFSLALRRAAKEQLGG